MSKKQVHFKLSPGIQIKDKIKGISGTLTSRCERINGCVQYFISPLYEKDGPKGFWTDFENIEILEGKEHAEQVAFEFNTGDRLKNRVNNKQGIATVRGIDMNGCIFYWFETTETNDQGKIIEFYAFEQELELVDEGLNAPTENPLKRKMTGCQSHETSGKYDN